MSSSSPEGGSAVSRARLSGPAVGAAVLGCAFAFVSAVNLVRGLRPSLLLDAEPSWAVARLILTLAVISGTVTAGVLGAALFSRLTRFSLATDPLEPVPLAPAALAVLSLAAFLIGGVVRLINLDSIPESLWVDEVTVMEPALALTGHWRDFSDAVRSLRFGDTPGTTGVLYLEYLRLVLMVFGIDTQSLRLHAALAGIACMLTTALLARQLLPRGGAALAAMVIAGLYWSIAMARLGWEAVVMIPLVDIATILLLRARRRSAVLSVCAGAVMGVGTHFYLSGWVAAVALLVIASWPPPSAKTATKLRRRLLLPAFFLVGFGLCVSPLFLLREGRTVPYFLRTQQTNVINEIRYWRSPMPIFEAAADALSAPWLTASTRIWPQDVRLGLVLRALLAVAFLRAIRRPRDELSMVVLAQGGAALAATVLGGHRGVPNGFRYGYLSDVTAVAIAGATLWTLLWVPRAARRLLAIAVTGLLLAGSLLAARDFLFDFAGPPGRDPSGEATMVGRAARRWERYGKVDIDPALLHFSGMVTTIRRYRLDPEHSESPPDSRIALQSAREFRIVRPGASLRPGERAVEQVRARGWTAAVVLGRKGL